MKIDTLIISAFPGTGKSYFCEHAKDLVCLDSDSSKFNKDEFPKNYIQYIKEKYRKVNIIFVSTHKEVRDALIKEKMKPIFVYPHRSLKDEYLRRYKERGNSEKFIELLDKNWDTWIDEMDEISVDNRENIYVFHDKNNYLFDGYEYFKSILKIW